MLELDLLDLPARLQLGTSSFSSQDWVGSFYPAGTKPGDFLTHYARVLRTVEIDATWYAMPSLATVEGWARKVPDGFTFSLKVPQTITHDAYLEGCEAEWDRFLALLEPLGEKRGPLLFQFPYVAKGKDAAEYATGDDFRRRLAAFLPRLPAEGRYVVEVRNEKWLGAPLFDLLRARGVALAFVFYFTMLSPARLLEKFAELEPVTADFAYLRFLGDHKQMDALVRQARRERGKQRDWDELLVDRARETTEGAAVARELLGRGIEVYAYFNNHFAGFAPGSLAEFVKAWRREPAP